MKTTLLCRGRRIEIARPLVMGILNLNDDSFSGDGTLDLEEALDGTRQMLADGADIIDVGGESARTNREAIAVEEEIRRVAPFIGRFRETWPEALLSINTWRPAVARALLPLGGDILNDLGALPTPGNAEICADHGAALVIMHSIGEPKIPHTHVRYPDILATQLAFFREKTDLAQAAGLAPESIILDPGIDFAKQRDDNLRLYREFDRIAALGFPTLLPVSRKTVIGDVLDLPNARERDAGTVACIVAGAMRGASIFRVHNVKAAAQTLRMIEAVK